MSEMAEEANLDETKIRLGKVLDHDEPLLLLGRPFLALGPTERPTERPTGRSNLMIEGQIVDKTDP